MRYEAIENVQNFKFSLSLENEHLWKVCFFLDNNYLDVFSWKTIFQQTYCNNCSNNNCNNIAEGTSCNNIAEGTSYYYNYIYIWQQLWHMFVTFQIQ